MTWHLETERLELRPFVREDVEEFLPVVSDPISMRFYPRPFDRDMAARWIERALERYEHDGFGLLAVIEKGSGSLVGDCGPAVMETGHGTFVELGWHILRDRQGRGYATEAGAACRDHAWETLEVDRLISLIRPENVPSWSVARALGFRPWLGEVRVGMAHIIWSVRRPGGPRADG